MWAAPTVASAVVKRATPTAPPSWRSALKRPEALPIEAGGIVAKPAAWVGTNTLPIPIPMTRSTPRKYHSDVP